MKAAEMLAKLCGWNEPEKVQSQHLHVHLDAGLIEELRQGHAALAARERARLPEGAPLALQEGQQGRDGAVRQTIFAL